MRAKAIGYLVECEGHGVMICVRGQLYFGKGATLFATRRIAMKAIKETKSQRLLDFGRDFESDFGKLVIRRVYDR